MSGMEAIATYQKRVEELRTQRGGQVGVDEIAEVIESLLGTLEGDLTEHDIRLYREVEQLVSYIRSAKNEIADLCPDDLREDAIPDATDQLDAIVSDTEKATGTILDSAEKIESIGANLDDETQNEIRVLITQIYEACNFQDVTGQRITKVVRALKHIETELDKLVSVFGSEIYEEAREKRKAEKAGQSPAEKDLLSGPQLPEDANNQDDIDALLASFD
jgi:chemotaxis protein CheZ